MDAHKNLAYSLVATAPSPATSGTSLVVTAAQGTRFPTTPFNATIWPVSAIPTPANAEIVRVTTVSTDTLTITRAQEGTSARTVVVGDQIAATITALTLTDAEQATQKLITQTAHGLAVADVVRHNGTDYVKAQANSAANAEVVGIVAVVVDSNNFVLHTGGRIAGLSGLTAGTVYFLDDDTAGLLTATEPPDAGDISKPLLVADSTTSGWFFNWRGSVVSAGSFPGCVLIDRQLLGSAGTFDFTSIPDTYSDLEIVLQVRATNAAAVVVNVTLNNDSSAIYYTESLQSNNTTNTAAAAVTQTAARVGTCPGSSDTAGRSSGIIVHLPNYAGTTFHKAVLGRGGRSSSAVAGGQVLDHAYNEYAATAAITRVTIAPSAGSTFVTGSVACLYGLG